MEDPTCARIFPLEDGNVRPNYNIQEVETVGQIARVVARIYATLEEVAGKIIEQSISILIDPGSIHSYITPKVV